MSLEPEKLQRTANNDTSKRHSGTTGVGLIVAVCIAEILGMGAYAGFPAQLVALIDTWNLSATDAGWISGSFYGGYAIAVPILVTLTDRMDPKRIYLPATLATAAGALGISLLASGYWTGMLFQALMGAGLAGTYMPGLRLLTDRLDGVMRSRAIAFYTSSYAVGTGASFALIGLLSSLMNWRWTFGLAAIGPVTAFVLIAVIFRRKTDAHRPVVSSRYSITSVLRDRRVLAHSIAYAAHNFELFGLWSWTVAFLGFAYSQHPNSGGEISPALVASLLTLLLLPASVCGNEIALRIGRKTWIVGVMVVSAMFSLVVAFSAGSVSNSVLTLLILIYGIFAAAESSALTSSALEAASPEQHGAAMALYSTLGFVGAFSGPLVFGLVLDMYGANSFAGWGAAFVTLGTVVLVGPIILIFVDIPRVPAGKK